MVYCIFTTFIEGYFSFQLLSQTQQTNKLFGFSRKPAQLFYIYPNIGIINTILNVTIVGEYFQNTTQCMLDNTTFQTTFVSSQLLYCNVTSTSVTGILRVNDGAWDSANEFYMKFYLIPTLYSVVPSQINANFFPIMLIIHGTDFTNDNTWWCELSQSHNGTYAWINNNTISCLFESAVSIGNNTLLIRKNNLQSNSLFLETIAYPAFDHSVQTQISSIGEMLRIYLYGKNLTSDIWCIYNQSFLQATIFNATTQYCDIVVTDVSTQYVYVVGQFVVDYFVLQSMNNSANYISYIDTNIYISNITKLDLTMIAYIQNYSTYSNVTFCHAKTLSQQQGVIVPAFIDSILNSVHCQLFDLLPTGLVKFELLNNNLQLISNVMLHNFTHIPSILSPSEPIEFSFGQVL